MLSIVSSLKTHKLGIKLELQLLLHKFPRDISVKSVKSQKLTA